MTPEIEAEINRFNMERNAAFLTLNEKTIRDHQLKWGGQNLPQDMNVFWASVHKAITSIKSLPLEFRKASKKYLDERKLQSLDDGDL